MSAVLDTRLAFNRSVVLRYWIYLGQKEYPPNTINLRLAAVCRVAYECGSAFGTGNIDACAPSKRSKQLGGIRAPNGGDVAGLPGNPGVN